MKTNKIIMLASLGILSAGLIFSSCKKKETSTEVDSDTSAAADHANAETHSNDIANIGDEASSANGLQTYKLVNGNNNSVYSTCATIALDNANATDNDTLIVNFGTGGCVGIDGRTRTGIIQYVYTAGMHYRDSGNVISVTTPGSTYYVDGNQVIVNNKTITNKGHITNGNLTWNVTASITINKSGGGTINWNTTKTKVLLTGEQTNGTIYWPTAKVAVYGSANGTSANGVSFSATVAESTWLVRDFSCTSFRRYFVSGEFDFTPSGKATRYVNFGTGACDNDATVTINGHVYNITLH